MRVRVRPAALAFVAAAFALPSLAHADLYTVEKNGQIYITSKKPRRGKVLYRLREDGRPVSPAARAKPRTRRRAGVGEPADRKARAQRFVQHVRGAALHYGLPESLIWAVMRVESDFKPHVVSHAGAQGLLQLMPGTADDMGVTDPFDPVQNIYGGARYLRILANRFDGDLVLTLSGYHAGGGAVNSVGGIPYARTADYVRMVLNNYYKYQKQLPVN